MTKPTKLVDFFEGRRRKSFLLRWEHLLTRVGESRFKLDLKFPLLNEPVLGMNGPVSEVFQLMAKDDSRLMRSNINVKLEGMTVECFSTGDPKESKTPSVSATGSTMVKFVMAGVSEGEKKEVNLLLAVYVPANRQWLDWLYVHCHQEFYLEAVYSQTELFAEDPEDPEDDEEDDEEFDSDEEDEEGPAEVEPEQPKKKSGPKDLQKHIAEHPDW